MLDQCSETCGWISGVIAALSFGSFGVPIKFISNVKVDPLVMQVSFGLFYNTRTVMLFGLYGSFILPNLLCVF